MDQQLISQIAQRANISPDQATQAAQAVVEYLKGKLPGPIGSQLDSLLGGQAGTGATQGNLGNMGNIPGMQGTGTTPTTPDMGTMGTMGNMGGGMGDMPNQTDQSLGGMTGGQQTQQP
ncbi:MAG TPA: hypothetical protein VIG30_04810 [Ktedonobacterales bacterium]